METKSRYEVIADLEGKKRELIREHDGFEDAVQAKKLEIKNLERSSEDIVKQELDFDFEQENAIAKLERDKKEFKFKIDNTKDLYARKIEDAKEELSNLESGAEKKKETITKLVDGINESLERFGKLQKK